MCAFDKQSWLLKIKESPEDSQLWWEAAKAAQAEQDLKFACLGYLVVLRLDTTQSPALQEYLNIRSIIHNSTLSENFRFDFFRLPKKTALFLLAGSLNMEIQDLEVNVLTALQHGYKLVILDCSGISVLSGLGPSFIRRMQQNCQKHQGELVLLQANPIFQGTLELKKIVVPHYTDLVLLFQSKP